MIHDNTEGAYFDMKRSGKFQPMECRILYALMQHPQSTREQLVEHTGMKLSSVCGRVRSLLDKGAVYECSTTKDTDSGKSQAMLKVRDFE